MSKKGANDNSRFYNIDWVRILHAQISTIMHEWCLQRTQVFNFWMSGVNNDPGIHTL